MAARRVTVPDLVGFGWEEARDIATAADLQPRAVGPDGQAVNGNGGVVIGQQPEAGSRVSAGSEIALRIAFGGGHAGSREPLDPLPNPREFEEWLNLPLDVDVPGREREPALAGHP